MASFFKFTTEYVSKKFYSILLSYTCYDVFLLSRIRDWGKFKFLFLMMLLPIFILLFCSYFQDQHKMAPKEAVGVVINGGDMIKKIQQDSRACVKFFNVTEESPEDKVCVVTGSPEQIQAASTFINDLIQSVVTAQKTVGGNLLFISKDHADYERLIDAFKSVSKEFKIKDLFVLINTDEDHEKEEIPKYKPERTGMDADDIRSFVIGILEEKIKLIQERFYKDLRDLQLNFQILTNNIDKKDLVEEFKKNQTLEKIEMDIEALIERNLILAFQEIIEGNVDSKYSFVKNSLDLSNKKLIEEIIASCKKQLISTQETEADSKKYPDNLQTISKVNNNTYYSTDGIEEKIKEIVKHQIEVYDADKIGKADYALESGGGSIVGTRCSETFETHGQISLSGILGFYWTYSNSPRTAIQPDVQPGRCWAFRGSYGFLVIKLAAAIYPTGFTLEHIPVSLSPTGSINSAPKNFSVWGLNSEKDNIGKIIGEYVYDNEGDPLQYFAVKIPSHRPYPYIELKIHTNYGNIEYTCLYRFRVHGNLA